jgi:hypothetical protein
VRFNETCGNACLPALRNRRRFPRFIQRPFGRTPLHRLGGRRSATGARDGRGIAITPGRRSSTVRGSRFPSRFRQRRSRAYRLGYYGTIGFLGQIDAAIAGKLSLRDIPAAAELDLAPLLAGARDVPQLKTLSRFPAVQRDVSLVVPENLRFEKIESLIRGLNLEFLESIDFVTTFRGKPFETGFKSVTIALVFRSPVATLTGEQVEGSVQKAIDAAKGKLGATLRG